MQALFDSCYGLDPDYSETGGWDNGKSIRNDGANSWFQLDCSAGKTKAVGFWCRNAIQSNYSTLTRNCLIKFIGPGISIWNTSSGFDIRRDTTQIATDTDKIGSDFHHIEIKVFSDASAGTVEIKIDGSSVYSGTGLNTGGQDITNIYFGRAGCYYSGVFIADDWVGQLRPMLLKPASDDSVQLTPSAGSDNYAMVDENAQDGDTTYVESDTVGHKDLYNFEDLPAGYTPYVASVVMVARESDAGGKSLKLIAKQDSTEYTLNTVVLPASYPAASGAGQYATLDTCPDDSALDRTKLNALKFGVEVA